MRLKPLLLFLGGWLGMHNAQAQTTLQQESFETSGEGTRYTSTAFDRRDETPIPYAAQYFLREDNPVQTAALSQTFGTNASPCNPTGASGTFFWASEGARGQTVATPDRPAQTLTLNPVTVTGYTALQVKVLMADARGPGSPLALPNWESTDFIRVKARFNGSGPFVTIGQFVGDNVSTGQASGNLRQDLNLDGASSDNLSAPIMGFAMQDFTFNITGSGTTLEVLVEVDQIGGAEEFAFDNIRVMGTQSATAPPVLAAIESTNLTYTEGQASPIVITSALTVSDSDSPTLTGATVSISPGFVSGQDQLLFTNQNGISGSYNTGSGVLTLSGSATLAAYQAALRSVRYQNVETVNATGGIRLVTFFVTDGTNTSNTQSRSIDFIAQLNAPAALPYTEDFETNGEGTRYASNSFTVAAPCFAFARVTTNPYACSPTTFGNVSGAGYWYAEGTSTLTNPSAVDIGSFVLAPVNATNTANLHFNVRLGIGTGDAPPVVLQWEIDDYVKFFYRVNGGSWVQFGAFFGDGPTNATSGNIRRDADLNGVADPTGTLLTTTLQNIDFTLPASVTGAAVDFMIEVNNDGQEELVFDRIVVTGTLNNPPSIGSQTRSIAENSPNGTTVGAAITASDADGNALTYAITAGNTNGTFAINSATGQLTVANSGALNFEVTPTYALTVQVTDNGTPAASSSATVTVNVTNVNEAPGAVTDVNPATNTVPENSATGTTVGITASATDPDAGTTLTYSLTDNAGGRFAINASTGVVTVANGALLDFETNTSHSITVQVSDGSLTSSQSFTIAVTDVDDTRPSVAITSTGNTNGGSTSTSPIPFTITFSESVTGFVQGDLTVSGGTISGFSGSGTTYTFNLTPSGSGTKTVDVVANVAQDGAGNLNTAAPQFSITYTVPATTVTSVTRLTPSPTATTQVSYRVVFAASVTGITVSNFSVTSPSGTVTGASVSSASGSGTTYTVTVNTGAGDGTLRLNVANSSGITPTVSNVPYTSGEVYTITKTFPAAPQLTIVGAGGTGSDVTAFVDVAQVLSGGTAFANGLQNGSFETHDPLANGDFGYQPTNASWTFNSRSGIAESGSAFTPTTPIPNGIAVAFLQSNSGVNGQLQQNLAVPNGTSYQVSFQAAQRVCCTTLDQSLNVFLNGVFLGSIQPNSSSYSTFTSPTFAVTAPALTATVSTTSGSPTGTSPIPFSVSFSQSVGTTFTASDVTVTGGTLNTGGFSGSGAGPYTFTVTPSGTGTVSVSLAANVANDANNTQNSASNAVSVQYVQPVTAAPVVTAPSNGSLINTSTPAYTGTTAANSTVTVYVDGTSIGTTTADGTGNFSLAQPTALAQGSHTVYATAQTSGSAVSANSNTNTFTVDSVRPTVAISSTAGASGSTTNTSPIPFTVTFSENVTGFVAGDVTVTNGSIGTVSGTGTTYTFSVTPTTAGTATTVNVPAAVAQDAAGNFNTAAPAAYSLTFVPSAIAIGPPSLPGGTVGTAYSQTVTASGGTAPYTYVISAGALPAGLTLTAAGVLSGTPTASGTFNFTVRATDNAPAPGPFSGTRVYSLVIAGPAIVVAPATLPAGTVASAYSQAITASGGTAPYTFAVTAGALPAGLSLTAGGSLSGTPTAGGSFTFTITATDASVAGSGGPYSGARSYTLAIAAPTITVVPATLPNGTVAAAYSQTITASGGTAPYGFAITAGALPAGLSLTAAGVLAGTPTAGGSFTFTVTATDASTGSGPYTGSRSYILTIGSQPVTAAPVVTSPADASTVNTTTPAYAGTAVANSTVTVYVDGTSIGTTTATAGGAFSLAQPTALAQGSHTVYATAQTSGSVVSANSSTNTFTVDSVQPTVTISSTAGASGSSTTTTPIPFAVTFSEAVTGFVAGDITVTNGSISGFTAVSGTTYTFNVTPTTAGTATTVNVPAAVAQDAAGNFNTAASSAYSLTYQPTAVTWNGSISGDWFTAGNWTPAVVPTTAIDATIPASAPNMPAISAGTASVKALNINSGATVSHSGGTLDVRANLTNNGTFTATGGTVALGTSTLANILGSSNTRFWNLSIGASGAQSSTSASTSVQRLFTLNGTFTTNGNPLTMESNATNTALLVNNGSNAIAGNVTVQRYIAPDLNPGLGYRHYSAPVSTATVGSLTTASFTPVVNPNYNTSNTPNSERPFPTVYYYDQARLATATNLLAPFDKGWTSPSALSDPLTVGKGYTVNLAANQTLSVTGPQNNGTVSQSLARTTAFPIDAGWQLLGNPYPSPLDYSLVAPFDRIGLDAALYVFESTSLYGGTYRANVNGVGGNANSPNAILAQGQGFFVRVSNGQTSGQLILRNSHRVTAYQNPVYHRTVETRPLVQLDLQGASQADPLYVYFENGATAGVDQEMDAVKLPNSTGLNLAAWTGTDKLAINALPLNATASVTVPLFIGLPVTGTYTLHAAQVLNFGAGEQPFLRDLQLGTLTDLSLHPDYTFTMNAANTTTRFELVFGARVLGVASAKLAAQVAVYPNPASKAVFVELPYVLNRKAVTAALVDALGRVVLTQALPAGLPTYTLPLTNLATGVYSLRLQTEAGVVVKKLVVE